MQFFTNVLNGQAPNLLLPDLATGRLLQLDFTTQTYDGEIGHSVFLGNRHRLTYGGNVRQNNFDITLAPLGENRLEVGAYLQDEIFWERVRLVLGGRVDKFGNLSDPKFSPRIAFLVKPAENHSVTLSYNRAFRAPSFINNALQDKYRQPGGPERPRAAPAAGAAAGGRPAVSARRRRGRQRHPDRRDVPGRADGRIADGV